MLDVGWQVLLSPYSDTYSREFEVEAVEIWLEGLFSSGENVKWKRFEICVVECVGLVLCWG